MSTALQSDVSPLLMSASSFFSVVVSHACLRPRRQKHGPKRPFCNFIVQRPMKPLSKECLCSLQIDGISCRDYNPFANKRPSALLGSFCPPVHLWRHRPLPQKLEAKSSIANLVKVHRLHSRGTLSSPYGCRRSPRRRRRLRRPHLHRCYPIHQVCGRRWPRDYGNVYSPRYPRGELIPKSTLPQAMYAWYLLHFR